MNAKFRWHYISVCSIGFDSSPTPGMDPGVRCHGMEAKPIGYLWSKYECFLTTGCQDIDF